MRFTLTETITVRITADTAQDALDLWLVPYALLHEPAQFAALESWFVEHAAEAVPEDAPWLAHAVEAF